ncbi:phage virion morphogenesis protein [Achromobacter insolitus]|uniref:phage virion morphogenesis protein n=1 Tax=Achromobacter insolitus TaxID=217204 RepID=UPI0028B16B46|nr:phage virion morphogenesis protein [Achromobacter insolitus]
MHKITVISQAVSQAFSALERGIKDATPLMREVAFVMLDAVEENFEQGGRPRWLGLAPDRREPATLKRTGRLRNSITPFFDSRSAMVGTNVVYARILQEGGRTSAHVIRPRDAKALRFNGGFYAKVNHPGSTFPARPFLALTEDDNLELELVGQRYLRSLID